MKSGKNPEWMKKLKDLFVIDGTDPAKGIQIRLPDPDAVKDPGPALGPGYGIHIVNGRIIREARHGATSHAAWTHAVGPAPSEIQKTNAGTKRKTKEPAIALDDLEFAVVDTETTGGGIYSGHRITEICIVRVDAKGKVLHEYSTLVNPGRSIPGMITALTNIDDSMVRMAPRFEDIAQDVRTLLRGRVFVAHNASFDWGFINAELVRTIRKPLVGKKLCTVRLARKVVPEVRKRSLDSLTYFFNVHNAARHRAYGDARATAEVFARMMNRVRERDIDTWQQLENMTLRRSQKRKRTAMPTAMDDVMDFL